jgi:hypothetical protein
LATAAPDDVLDTVLGVPQAEAGGITVRARSIFRATCARLVGVGR